MFKLLADSIIHFADLLGLSDPQKVLLTGLTILLEALLLYWLVARRWQSALAYSFVMNAASAFLAKYFWAFMEIFFPIIIDTRQYSMLGYWEKIPAQFLLVAFIGSLILSLLIEGFFMFFWWQNIREHPEGKGVTSWQVFMGLVVANVVSYMLLWGPAVVILQLTRIPNH